MVSHAGTGAVAGRAAWARAGAYHQTFHLALHQEILDFERYVSPTADERAQRAGLVDRLRSIVAEVFPAAEVQVFGSFATNLYLPTSDVDVCVMASGLAQQNALQGLGSALRSRGFGRVQCIDNAKVPIVKCVDERSGIHIDVSFDVANGPANVELITQYLVRYPALRPLVLVLKCFLLQRKLNDVFSGGIGSYCLILIVMSHLQMYPSNFCRPGAKPSLGLLLIDFFQLYGKLFNYTTVGLAPRGHGSYFSKAARGLTQQGRPHMLSVEDPQDSENDVAKNSYNIFSVRRALAYGHSLLAARELAHAGNEEMVGTTLGALVQVNAIKATRARENFSIAKDFSEQPRKRQRR